MAYVQQWREHRQQFQVPVGPTLPVTVDRELAELAGGSTRERSRDERYLGFEQGQMRLRNDGSGLSA